MPRTEFRLGMLGCSSERFLGRSWCMPRCGSGSSRSQLWGDSYLRSTEKGYFLQKTPSGITVGMLRWCSAIKRGWPCTVQSRLSVKRRCWWGRGTTREVDLPRESGCKGSQTGEEVCQDWRCWRKAVVLWWSPGHPWNLDRKMPVLGSGYGRKSC